MKTKKKSMFIIVNKARNEEINFTRGSLQKTQIKRHKKSF